MTTFSERYETYRREIETYLAGQYTAQPEWKDLYESIR